MMRKIFKQFEGRGVRSQLLRGVAGSAGIQIINTLFLLIISVLIARILGPNDFGIYTFIFSIITLLSLPFSSGLSLLVMRETAKKHLTKEWGGLRGAIIVAKNYILGCSFLVATVSIFVLWGVKADLEYQSYITFMWALLLLPFIGLNNVSGAVLRGLRHVVIGNLPISVIGPAVTIISLYACILLGREIDPILVFQINIVTSLIVFLVLIAFLARFIPNEVFRASPSYETKEWLKSLIPLSLYSALTVANFQISIVFLGSLSGNSDVALFRVAMSGATLIVFGLTAVNTVLAPHITQLYHKGEKKLLQKIITKSARLILFFSLPIALVLVIFGEKIIVIVFGIEYADAALSLSILSFGQLLNASAGSVVLILNMTGNEKETMKGMLIAFGLNVILSLVLIPFYGLVGAAIASATTIAVWNIILVIKTYINKH